MRRAAKRDASEAPIIDALLQLGWSVQRVNAKDDPDLVIGKDGRTYHAEVKTGKAKLRPGQEEFRKNWKGHPVLVLRSVDDVLGLRKLLRRPASRPSATPPDVGRVGQR